MCHAVPPRTNWLNVPETSPAVGRRCLELGGLGSALSCSFFFLMSKPLTSCTSEPLYKNTTPHNHKQYHTDQGKEWGEVCLLVLILPVSCLRLVLPEGCRGSIGRETQKAPAGIGKWGRREGAQEVVQGRLPGHGAGHTRRSLARAMAAALSQQGSGLVGGWAAPHSGCPGVWQLGDSGSSRGSAAEPGHPGLHL